MTCNECRWKTERNKCPWNFMYEGTEYAEDCIDFRNVNSEKDAFIELEEGDPNVYDNR